MQVQWTPEMLMVRTATGDTAPRADAEPEAGKKAEDAKKDEKAKPKSYVRGLEIPRHVEVDKPVLVYFHWPHEDGRRGKSIRKFCAGPLDDEVFVRFSPLFHCVEVNTKDSDERVIEELKVVKTPALMVLKPDFEIVWRSDDARLNGKGLVSALRKVLAKSFPERWKEITETTGEQREALKEAKVHIKKKQWDDAEGLLFEIVESDVRFEKTWPEARELLKKVQVQQLKQMEEE